MALLETFACPLCGKVDRIEVTSEQYWDFVLHRSQKNIAQLLPQLTLAEREQFISGTCPPCWDKYIKEPEEKEKGEFRDRC